VASIITISEAVEHLSSTTALSADDVARVRAHLGKN